MISPIYFVIKPKAERLYSEVQEGVIASTTIEDHKFVNRMAEVVSVPLMYNGPISVGDEIIVHHNIFRKFLNVKGKEIFSNFRVKDNLYRAPQETVFAYKKPGGDWLATDGFLFVSPVENFDIFTSGREKALYGVVEITGDCMQDKNIIKDTKVCFRPNSEYEFVVDGKKLYRIRESGICLVFRK